MFVQFLHSLPNTVTQGIIWGIMAIGVYITYKILNIPDMTVDGSIVTGMAVCAVLMIAGWNVWLAMLVATLAGMLAGLVTAVFHTLMGIPAILAGILTQLILWSVNLKIMGSANLNLSARTYKVLLTQMLKTKSLLIIIPFAIVLVGLLYWFFGTEIGRAFRATGCNPDMSRAQGINTRMMTILGLVLSNGIVALAGALLCQFQGYSDINSGRGAIVVGLAAIIIGEALFSRIARNFAVRLLTVIIGGIIYYLVYQIVIFLGLDADLLKMLSAIVVALFLAVPYWQSKIRGGRPAKVNPAKPQDPTPEEVETDA
ncbi:MAG: ABC transporter permease [Eubacteriales bacterium]|nr:ABC transporter permease [Eubacteriales bacterium]